MTMAEMTQPAAMADTAPPPTRHLGLRVVLIIVAIVEAFDALSSVSTLFGDMSQIPGPDLGGFLIKAHIATHLPLALAAPLFAAIGRVRHAIIALGAVVAMTWLNTMPSVVLHGLEFDSGFAALQTTAQIIAFPLLAACAIALAARPAARACHRAGQHSRAVQCVRRDRVCDRRQPARILTARIVIAGLDPAIHLREESFLMDARVKPAHDEFFAGFFR